MEHYVKSFRKYNKAMIDHFLAREAEMESLEENWIQNRGETTRKMGFASYLVGLKEDERVMETWKVAQQMHLLAMGKCEEVRNKTMKVHG